MELGTYLRDLRKRANVGGVAAAEALGVPRATLYMWEGTRTRIDPVDIRRVATHYGATEEEIAEALRLRSLVPPHDDQPTLAEVAR